MGAVKMVFVQPRIHNLPQFAHVHRLVMIIQTFPLERSGEPLDKRLFLGGFGPCPVLGTVLGSKIALRILHVLAAVVVDDGNVFSEAGNRFLQSGFGVPARR
jgi:hypothetical protein